MKVRYVTIYECLSCKYDDDICFIFSVLFFIKWNRLFITNFMSKHNTVLPYEYVFFLFFRYTDNLIDVLLSREEELPYTYLKQTIVHIE